MGLRTSLDKQFLGNCVISITKTITISPFHDHIEEVAEVWCDPQCPHSLKYITFKINIVLQLVLSLRYTPYLSADVYTPVCIRRFAKTLLHALCNTANGGHHGRGEEDGNVYRLSQTPTPKSSSSLSWKNIIYQLIIKQPKIWALWHVFGHNFFTKISTFVVIFLISSSSPRWTFNDEDGGYLKDKQGEGAYSIRAKVRKQMHPIVNPPLWWWCSWWWWWCWCWCSSSWCWW